MPESVVSFQSLPPEYQHAIQIVEEKYEISISPLQELAGGWSGAVIYLVRVASTGTGKVEHLILKLDRVRPNSTTDEISRHQNAKAKSTPEFSRKHIPEIAYERVEIDDILVILYTIAGQSLHNYRTLSNYRRQSQISALFAATNHYLLEKWNSDSIFEQFQHPQELLLRWLGFRLDPGQKIEAFLTETCLIDPEVPGLIVQGNILPNPLVYARSPEMWGTIRPGDAIVGLQHGDLNTNNILAKISRKDNSLDGYYLIDFALFKEDMPLLYDHRYLEMSYLVNAISRGSFAGVQDLILRYSQQDILEDDQAPVEVAGVNAAIRAGRVAFGKWVESKYPSLEDDLWGQYWLAGAAAGLSYCHKAGQEDLIRLAGLISAGANLKQYLILFNLPMPSQASELAIAGSREEVSLSAIRSKKKEIPNNLPASPTRFIGRETSLGKIRALMLDPDVRLVTLTGPGGTGKTRLGLEVGRIMLDTFPDGVFFIDLAQVTDPSMVAATTAHTLGIREGGGQPPLETLKDYLADKKVLILFDNFEQVTDAAQDIGTLLAFAPGVKALVTSRIRLHLRWEHEYPVSPLDLPEDLKTPLGNLEDYEAVALFLQQARAVNPSFEITEENSRTIVKICQRLDGLPLAIEIAAARVKLLSPDALLSRLGQSLDLLVGGAQDLPRRQQTIRQTIEWSYELLRKEEQELFTCLGVFSGGFSLEAAEDICNTSGDLTFFSKIETLLNNNLLRQVHSVTGDPRFDMLKTIREYALEKASEQGLLDELRWAHCGYFAALAQEGADATGYGVESTLWLQRYEEEHDNFRAVLSWALQYPERGAFPVIIILGQLNWFWYRHGHLQEGTDWMERTLAVSENMGDSIQRASALVGRAYLALWSGDLKIASNMSKESVELSQRIGFDLGLSMAKLCYGTALINLGEHKNAYPYLVDAVELFDQQDQFWMKGTAMVHLANASLGLGDTDQAGKWLDMAMPFLMKSNDVWSMAFGLSNYGEVARTLGDYEKAEMYYRRTEELYKQADAKGDQARLVTMLGYIAQHKGDYQEARSLFLESLADFRNLGNHRGIAECLAAIAGLAAEEDEYQWAVPLLSAAERLLTSFGGAWWPADLVEIKKARERTLTALGDGFQALWDQGQSMTTDSAITYALEGPRVL